MEKKKMKATAIIILNYNNYEDTINCIESVEHYNTAPVKYIVVDNGSTIKDAVCNIDLYLRRKFEKDYLFAKDDVRINKLPYATFIVSEKNSGYASGNNKGLRLVYNESSVDSILILNNDVLFVEDIIPSLRNIYYNKLSDVAILSPILYKRDLIGLDYNCARNNISIPQLIKDNFLYYYYIIKKLTGMQIHPDRYLLLNGIPDQECLKIDLPSGSCMFIDKQLFKSIGSFDQNTFLYWEENILFKKVEAIKKQNYLCTKIKCIHLGASSTSKTPSNFIVNCNINSMLYYTKVYSGCTKFLYLCLKLSCSLFKSLFYIQKKIQNKK